MPVRKMEQNDMAACEKIQAIAFVSPFDAQAVDERLKKEGCPRDEYVGYENEEGTITACMVLPRYQMRYEGAWVPMVGVGGVASLPEHRSGGAIRQIFEAELPRCRAEGVVFTMLYPFSHSFYRKFGYELCQMVQGWEVDTAALSHLRCGCKARMVAGKEDYPALRAVFEAHFGRYNTAVLREDRHWESLLSKEPCKERVYSYLLEDGEGPLAYVIFQAKEATAYSKRGQVREMAWARPQGFREALGFLYRLSAQYDSFTIPLPEDAPLAALLSESYDIKPLVMDQPMARVLHVPKALAGKPCPEGAAYTIAVEDQLLPENSGTFQVRCQNGETTVERTAAPADLTLDVRTLTQLLLGTLSLEEALYKPDVVLAANRETLEKVFPKRPVFLTEHF